MAGGLNTRLTRVEARLGLARVSGVEGSGVLVTQTSRGVMIGGKKRTEDDDPAWKWCGEWVSTSRYDKNDVIVYGSNEMANATRKTLFRGGVQAGVYIALKSVSANNAPTGLSDDENWEQIASFSGPGIGFKDPDQTNTVQIIVADVPQAYGEVKLRKMDFCYADEEYDCYALMTQIRKKSDGTMREPTSGT